MAESQQSTAAVIRQGSALLLLRQQGVDDPEAVWGLPGGKVGEGDLLPEALVRQVRKNTGLEVLDPGQLIYMTQLHTVTGTASSEGSLSGSHSQLTTFVFEVRDWSGEAPAAALADGILEAEFVAPAEAIRRVNAMPGRVVCEPLVAYLRGDARPGTVWSYRRDAQGEEVLIGRLDGTGSSEAWRGRLPPAMRRQVKPRERRRDAPHEKTPRTLNQQLALASCLIVVLAFVALILVGIIAVLPHFL